MLYGLETSTNTEAEYAELDFFLYWWLKRVPNSTNLLALQLLMRTIPVELKFTRGASPCCSGYKSLLSRMWYFDSWSERTWILHGGARNQTSIVSQMHSPLLQNKAGEMRSLALLNLETSIPGTVNRMWKKCRNPLEVRMAIMTLLLLHGTTYCCYMAPLTGTRI